MKPNRSKDETNPSGIMVMTATFAEKENATELTVRVRFETDAIRDAMLKMGMNEGWSQSLNRLHENLHMDALAAGADAGRELVMARIYHAPRELVWDAWTNPDAIVKWWGPTGFTDTIQEMDVRPGGTWRHIMRGPDGREFPNLSTYLEVTRPVRLTFQNATWPHHRSTATFDDLDGRTLVTLRMVFESAALRDEVIRMHNALEGARETLGRLADELARNSETGFPQESACLPDAKGGNSNATPQADPSQVAHS